MVSTHTEAAILVARGQADVAIGVQAAAVHLGLDFIPLFEERYDLVFECEHQERLLPLLDLLNTAAFRKAVEALPGYRAAGSGQVYTLEVEG